MGIYNLLLLASIGMLSSIIILPIGSYLPKAYRVMTILFPGLIFFLALYKLVGVSALFSSTVAFVLLWSVLAAFNLDRHYVYKLLIFVGLLTFIFVVTDIAILSRTFATLFFCLMVVAVFKDFFYEKIFK